MPEIAVPRIRDDMTPEWMTEVLRSGGYLGDERVATVAIEDIGIGRGYVGQTLRIRSTFDGAAPEAPETMVAKIPTFVEFERESDKALIDLLYSTEIQWYRDLRADCPVRVPESYWGGMAPEDGRYCLLLEDMGDLGTSDQLTGCTPAQAELAVTNLAKIHAQWWESERLEQFDWLPTSEFQGGMARDLYTLGWGPFREAFESTLPAAFAPIGERIGPLLPDLYARGSESAKTLVHGDYRIENFLFGEPGTAEEFVVLDWQIVGHGSGPRDLGYLLGQSLTTEVRRDHEQRLLRLYHETLLEHGVGGYDFERCYADYRLGLLITMFIPVNGVRAFAELIESGGGDLSEKERAGFEQAMAERNVAAILDNDAGALLDDLG